MKVFHLILPSFVREEIFPGVGTVSLCGRKPRKFPHARVGVKHRSEDGPLSGVRRLASAVIWDANGNWKIEPSDPISEVIL